MPIDEGAGETRRCSASRTVEIFNLFNRKSVALGLLLAEVEQVLPALRAMVRDLEVKD